MLMALSFLLFKKKNEVFKDLTIIFGTSAIWTIIFGILFGSFFGELINLTPLWIDPFQDSILILGVSIALGFIHLNIGLLISVYSNIINKRFKNILFDNVSIFILEASILMFVLQQNILGFALLAITTIMLLIKSSLFGLMEITGFVGLVLSYARILALSLATGGIALAINIMSKKIMDLGIIGVILSPLLIVGGHLFNFVLNIIGSSINAARLHFVEFFSLFFEEGGEKFIPFKIKK
jgi:V/A-type H+-transporting ATPase subunit I